MTDDLWSSANGLVELRGPSMGFILHRGKDIRIAGEENPEWPATHQ